MNDLASIWAEASRLAADGAPAAFATVARQRGSLPMASDAKMLVTPDGGRRGTVGGGCMEADVMQQALDALEAGHPVIVKHSLNADVAGNIGLSCGGTVDLFLEPLLPSDALAGLCRTVAEGIQTRACVTVVTRLEWNGGAAKAAQVDDRFVTVGALPALDLAAYGEQRAGSVRVDRERDLFVERIARRPRVVIFGAGHVGAAIAHAAAHVGFHVVVVDDREDFANPSHVPDAHEIIVDAFHAVLDRMTFDEDDYLLATTRGHAFDANIIERTAGSRARYVGMLGSRRKQKVIWKALRVAGVPDAALARVKTPIGIDIGAETPAEIAVSVVAELIRVRRLAEAGEERAE